MSAIPDPTLALRPVKSGTVRSEKLWKQAFEKLEQQDSDLALAISSQVFGITGVSAVDDPGQLADAISKKLVQRDEKRWVVHIVGKPIKIREQFEKILKFILWADDFVACIVRDEPHAALAWAGVSLLLPVCPHL